MICIHLKELFQYCKDNNVRLSSSDLVRVVCKQCGMQEVCPSTLVEQIELPTDEVSENGAEHRHAVE